MIIVYDEKEKKVRKAGLKDLVEAIYALTELVPIGKVTTYGSIARVLGVHPRLVGRALSQNKKLVIIPCHRVVRSDLTLDGYNKGLGFKKKLLEIEGVGFDNDKVSKKSVVKIETMIGL